MKSTRNSVFWRKFPTETPVLDTDKYFNEFRDLLRDFPPIRHVDKLKNKEFVYEFYAQAMGLTREQVDELNEVTSDKHLKCEGEISSIDHKLHESNSNFQLKYGIREMSATSVVKLVSVKKRLETGTKIISPRIMKYGHYVWLPPDIISRADINLNPFDYSHIVFCIKVYRPFLSNATGFHEMKLLQEIHVLGDDLLSDFKDKIVCSMDYCGIDDVSLNPMVQQEEVETAFEKKDDYMSSFIFIENQFFNDTRNTVMKDLSKTIRNWAEKKKLGSFTTGVMEETRFKDLKLKIGYPYVYQHQGDCEHVLVVSDIRFLNVSDVLVREVYPRIYAKGRCIGKYCMMCGASFAKWLVTGNERLTHDKAYFCSKCLMSYNYVDGVKIGNFKVFKYIDQSVLL